MTDPEQQRIAVIGAGVAGMAAAWHLHVNTSQKVQLFEARQTLGGHAWTVQVPTNQQPIDVDIGFMVFNHDNYPNMVQWFQELGVAAEDSDMSLSVSLDQGIEWSSDGLDGLLASRSNALNPSFYCFFHDMMRFNQEAPAILRLDAQDPRRHVTTGQYLRHHGYSTAFATYYLVPMMAALWSASLSDVLKFPAVQLIAFLCHHKMLQLFDRPQWKTVKGRSQTYTAKVASILGPEAVHSLPQTCIPWCESATRMS